MADKTVEILLEMTTKSDRRGADALLKDYTRLQAMAEKLKQQLDKAHDPKRVENLRSRLAGVEAAMRNIGKESEKLRLEASMKKAAEATQRTREQMEKIAQVGQRLAMVGAAITAPLVLGIKKYVDEAKDFEPTSRRILEANEKWERVQTRIGRVLAREVVPGLEKAADIADKIASFVEANPGVASAILNIGAVLTVGGALAASAAQLAGTMATIRGLTAAGGGTGAMAGASGTLAKASFAIGVAYLSFEGGRQVTKNLLQDLLGLSSKQAGLESAIQQNIVNPAAGVNPTLGRAAGLARDFFLYYGGFEKTLKDAVPALKETSGGLNKLAKDAKKTGESLMSDETIAARKKAVDDLVNAETKLTAARKNVASVAADIAQAEKKRQMERRELIANAQKEERRAEQDHRRALLDIQRERNKAVSDAVQSRDALALVRAEQDAQEKTDQENEQYRVAAQRRREDLNDQLRAFDARAQLERQAEQQRLLQAQQAAQIELDMVRKMEQAKLQIFAQAMTSINRLAQRGVGSLGVGSILPFIPPTNNNSSQSTTQNVTVQMAGGQSITAVRREIAANNRNLAGALNSALAGV